jgi:hypothetical protein
MAEILLSSLIFAAIQVAQLKLNKDILYKSATPMKLNIAASLFGQKEKDTKK